MDDYRMNVSITITGRDGRTAQIGWRVNWWPDRPEHLYRELVRQAKRIGLRVEDKSHLFDSES